MKRLGTFFLLFSVLLCMSCSEKQEKKEEKFTIGKKHTSTNKVEEKETTSPVILASKKVDLTNKGIGPISSIELPENTDSSMVTNGQALFKTKCMACHKVSKKFIGPPVAGILKRRTPEWVMNMMLNPEEMVQKDPLAKELFIEFNGSPMANQSLSKEEARTILEYLRTL